jgi:hypothetical protein
MFCSGGVRILCRIRIARHPNKSARAT